MKKLEEIISVLEKTKTYYIAHAREFPDFDEKYTAKADAVKEIITLLSDDEIFENTKTFLEENNY